MDATDAFEIVLDQVPKAYGLVKILLPAFDAAIDTNRHKSLFADGAAIATGFVTSGQMCQRVCEVIKLAPVKKFRRHVILEPEHLWYLHLDAHGAADVAQQVVAGGVDLGCLLHGPVVEPQDDISIIAVIGEVWAGDRNWLVRVMREDGERASCIETDALDAGW